MMFAVGISQPLLCVLLTRFPPFSIIKIKFIKETFFFLFNLFCKNPRKKEILINPIINFYPTSRGFPFIKQNKKIKNPSTGKLMTRSQSKTAIFQIRTLQNRPREIPERTRTNSSIRIGKTVKVFRFSPLDVVVFHVMFIYCIFFSKTFPTIKIE